MTNFALFAQPASEVDYDIVEEGKDVSFPTEEETDGDDWDDDDDDDDDD